MSASPTASHSLANGRVVPPLPLALALASVVLAALSLVGCEARRFASAQTEDTPAAYRRFLARYPLSKRGRRVRLRLEEAVYRLARGADRPLGYRDYLARYPRGRHAGEARRRLAALAFARARTAEDFELVVERYRSSPLVKRARLRLAALLAKRALASASPATSRRYLRRFGDQRHASGVRAHLAGLLLGQVGRDIGSLERFVARWHGTPAARIARAQLGARLAALVEREADPGLLELLRSRYPQHRGLARLEKLVRRMQLQRALMRLDLVALLRLRTRSSSDDVAARAKRVLAWCRARVRPCRALAKLARAAGPFRPDETIAALTRALFDTDPAVAWRAMAALSWHRDLRAARRLLDRVGAPRIATVAHAARALRAWLSRATAQRRARFLRRALARRVRRANPGEAQRAGWLAAIAGKGGSRRRGLSALRALLRRGRALTAGYLLAEAATGGFSRKHVGSVRAPEGLIAALSARARWLDGAFPANVTKESRVAAALCERELYTVVAVLRRLAGQRAAQLRRELEARLAGWRVKLVRADRRFKPAGRVDLASEQRLHARGRIAAVRALRRRRGPVARVVLAAICRTDNPDRRAVATVCPKPARRRSKQRRRKP